MSWLHSDHWGRHHPKWSAWRHGPRQEHYKMITRFSPLFDSPSLSKHFRSLCQCCIVNDCTVLVIQCMPTGWITLSHTLVWAQYSILLCISHATLPVDKERPKHIICLGLLHVVYWLMNSTWNMLLVAQFNSDPCVDTKGQSILISYPKSISTNLELKRKKQIW